MGFLAAFFIGGSAYANAQDNQRQTNERELKAGFLTLFPQYISWPTSAALSTSTASSKNTDSIMICVLGSDPFGFLLDQSALARKGTKSLAVKRITTPDDSEECQIVFIAKTESRREAAWLKALKGKPLLTVGESGETIARGGAIEFRLVDDRIRFEVNLVAVTSAHLNISSAMLSYASKVYREPSISGDLQ